ncbi:tail fiber protein [Muricauda brasiliensis]|uniref:tail fiber protein n=1 Tax=Muricauda brasiliensis TaxID=2162892 RepID=UPI000D3B72F4|nr:tail fiber protein [Muricauda brasiliensis]
MNLRLTGKKSWTLFVLVLSFLITTNVLSQWQANGSDIFYNDGKIGVGFSNPIERFEVNGNLKLQNSNGQELIFQRFSDKSPATIAGLPGEFTTRQGLTINTSLVPNAVNVLWNGNMGIGTLNPEERFDINGNVRVNRMVKIDGHGSVGSLQIMDNSDTQTLDVLLRGDEGNSYILSGNFGLGTTNPDARLTVKGKVHAEEVKVDLSVPGPDYVFKEGYDLMSLEEVQTYIAEHGHLPNIPSAEEMQANGIQLGEMNMKLLEKIEELVLYTIKQEIKIERLEASNDKISELEESSKKQNREIEKLKEMIKIINK